VSQLLLQQVELFVLVVVVVAVVAAAVPLSVVAEGLEPFVFSEDKQ